MNQYETLTDILYAHRDTDDKGITIIRNQNHETFISYKSLFHKALNRLYSMQYRGIRPGNEIILQIEDIEDFLVTFWAGVFGRFIVIPLPMRTTEESVLHLLEIWKRLENPFLLTDKESNGNVVFRIKDCAQQHGFKEYDLPIKEHTLFIDELSQSQAVLPGKLPEIQREDIAFIQYSSGSTGKPKGVVLTHDNILTNVRAIIRGIKVNAADTSLSWLPVTHDMGLIGFHLTPVATGCQHYLMPVPLFIRRPLLWLKKAAQHRVTILGAPDFGLKFFLSAFNPEKDYGWDLSAVRLVFNGAEPINCTVCKQFGDNLKKYRLKNNCIFPVYGLAEAALAVSFPKMSESIRSVVLSRNTLAIGDLVETVDKEEENSNNGIGFVDVGAPVAGCRVKIVDTNGSCLEENRLGCIFIKGKNVTHAYYKDEILTRNLIRNDGWLDTGDLGFMLNGRLIVTGRQKDVIVVNGQNYYLHDLERMAEEVEGIKPHKIAVCGINDPDAKVEALCAFVVFRRDIEAFIPLLRRLNNYIYRKAGISFKYIIPVQKLPHTSSGKLKRHQLVRQYREGEFADTLRTLRQCMEQIGQKKQIGNRTDNPIEQQLLPIVCRVMEIVDIGIHDNLSEYGVNSIKLHQLHQEVETLYPGMVKIVDFYDHPTVSQLAALIAKRENSLADNENSHERHLVSSKPVKMRHPSVKRLALLFPGQGSQHVGMGEEMCRYFPVANRTFEEASDILHQDLKALCFDGDQEELTRTENAQPALLTISVAKFRVYQQELGIIPFLGAGHSLGEYSALTCANAIAFSDAVNLVRIRGELMQEACEEGTAGMMAISGIHKNAVEEEIEIYTDPGNCIVIANYNSATQVVISGHKAKLAQVGERLIALGARVVPLKVSAAFHSPLMEPCAKAFAAELTKYRFHMPEWPVIANVNGLPYKDKESIPILLKKQMTHPIQWQVIMEYMKQHGIDAAIELGPKKVLKNLMKKASRHITVYSTNTREDLEELYELEPEDFVDKRPNFLERCLAMAVCTPNRNFNDKEFLEGVIEPYRILKEMYYRLADEKKEPEAHHIKKAAALLRKIFYTKKVPMDQQNKRFNRIFEETETGHLFN